MISTFSAAAIVIGIVLDIVLIVGACGWWGKSELVYVIQRHYAEKTAKKRRSELGLSSSFSFASDKDISHLYTEISDLQRQINELKKK